MVLGMAAAAGFVTAAVAAGTSAAAAPGGRAAAAVSFFGGRPVAALAGDFLAAAFAVLLPGRGPALARRFFPVSAGFPVVAGRFLDNGLAAPDFRVVLPAAAAEGFFFGFALAAGVLDLGLDLISGAVAAGAVVAAAGGKAVSAAAEAVVPVGAGSSAVAWWLSARAIRTIENKDLSMG